MSKFATALLIASASTAISYSVDADDIDTNKNEYGIFSAVIDLDDGIPLAAETPFSISIPKVGNHKLDFKCYVADKDSTNPATSIKVSSSTKKDIATIVGAFSEEKTRDFILICDFTAPDATVKSVGTFTVGNYAPDEFDVEIKDKSIAKTLTVSSSGERTKGGFKLDISKLILDTTSRIRVQAEENVKFSRNANAQCDLSVDKTSVEVSVVTSGESQFYIEIPADVILSANKSNLKLNCKEKSNFSAYKEVQKAPGSIKVSTYTSANMHTGDSYIRVNMGNSALSLASGAALVASVASLLAFVF